MTAKIDSSLRLAGSVLLSAATLLMCSSFARSDNYESRPADWTLVWSDEFDSGPAPEYPNADNWQYETGYVRNQEWQYYTRDLQNAWCQDGYLNIAARKHPAGTLPAGKYAHQDGSISSASLISRGLIEHQYGWLEIRARIDTRAGSWPAFWTMGADGAWPDGGECDILEYFRGRLWFNTYWWKSGDDRWIPRRDTASVRLDSLTGGWPDEFHVWAMQWTPDEITLYLNGSRCNSWEVSRDSGDSSREGFRQPHFMIINQAIGGKAGGDASDLGFPTHYIIDYVRWYQQTAD